MPCALADACDVETLLPTSFSTILEDVDALA